MPSSPRCTFFSGSHRCSGRRLRFSSITDMICAAGYERDGMNERQASRKRLLLMLVFGGGILAFGGCALYLTNTSFSTGNENPLSTTGALTFIAGMLAFVFGVLWAFARWVDRRFDRSR